MKGIHLVEITGFPFGLTQSAILRTDAMNQTDFVLELFSLNALDNHCLCLFEFLRFYWDIPVFFWGLEARTITVLFLEAKANCNCSFCFIPTREIPQTARKWKRSRDCVVMAEVFFISGSSGGMYMGSALSRILCLFSGFPRKSGPFHQREFSMRFCTYRPQEASSAGFLSVSTYFHWLGAVQSRIC